MEIDGRPTIEHACDTQQCAMDRALVSISRFISRVLRHDPASIGLVLDAQGWADVAHLIRQADRHGRSFNHDQLLIIVEQNDKQRFELSSDRRRIRAAQGHSISVDLGLTAVVPPEWLFHGTAAGNLDSIRREGLKPGKRQHVHLSATVETAVKVGGRHGTPVVLPIRASELAAQGQAFLLAANAVWLTGSIESRWINWDDLRWD